MELTNQIVEAGLEAVEKAAGPVHLISTITNGHFYTSDYPNAETIMAHVENRIASLDKIIRRVPFTIEHAKAALEMVCNRQPPNNDKNQQYKDSAIWQSLLDLSDRYSVVLITGDKGFFMDRTPSKGLARNLLSDCKARGVIIQAYDSIASYLNILNEQAPTFDKGHVKDLICVEAKSRLANEAERWKIIPSDLLAAEITGFSTDSEEKIAVDYALTYRLDYGSMAINDDGQKRGVVHGSCYYHQTDRKITNHYIQRVAIRTSNSTMSRSFEDYNNSLPFPRPIQWLLEQEA